MKHLHETLIDFAHIANTQENKGIKKYGQPLEPINDDRNWLDMAKEELVDGYKYLHAEQVKRDFIVTEVRRVANMHLPIKERLEINKLLDRLVGK